MKKLGICCFLFVLGTSVFAQYGSRSGGGGNTIGIIIGVVIGAIIIFLICRELICWYYKINTIVELLSEQNKLLGELSRKIGSSGNVQHGNVQNSSGLYSDLGIPTAVNSGDSWVCKKCSEKNPNTAPTCKGCGAYK